LYVTHIYNIMRHRDSYFAFLQQQCQKALGVAVLSLNTPGGNSVLNGVFVFGITPDQTKALFG